MSDRLDAIEEKLAHLERAMAQISDVVARQQKELDRALDRNQRLMDKSGRTRIRSGPERDRAREAAALLILGAAASPSASAQRGFQELQRELERIERAPQQDFAARQIAALLPLIAEHEIVIPVFIHFHPHVLAVFDEFVVQPDVERQQAIFRADQDQDRHSGSA